MVVDWEEALLFLDLKICEWRKDTKIWLRGARRGIILEVPIVTLWPQIWKALKSNFKSWHKEVFDNVSIQKEMTFNLDGFWDSKEMEGALS